MPVDEFDVEHGDGVGIVVGRGGGGEDGEPGGGVAVAVEAQGDLVLVVRAEGEGFGDGERDDAVDGEGGTVAREKVVPLRAAAVELRAARRGDEVAAVEIRSRGNGRRHAHASARSARSADTRRMSTGGTDARVGWRPVSDERRTSSRERRASRVERRRVVVRATEPASPLGPR